MKKQNMNKKVITPLMVILGIGIVIAGGYYVLNTDTFNVKNIVGMGTYTDNVGDVEYPNSIDGTLIELDNNLVNDRELSIVGVVNVIDDTPNVVKLSSDIAVEYKADLELTKKDVDFNLDVWNIPIDADKVQVEYTIVGDEFSAEVVIGARSGYVLIYYADAEDRFANPEVAILVEDVGVNNLPYDEDANKEFHDYSAEYDTSHGSKIWYVPSDAIDSEDSSLDWTRANEFYFESKLIQFNTAGEITFYSGDSLDITPKYTPDEHAVGSYTIETIVA